MKKEEILECMCDRNSKGDKSVCFGGFTIDYLKDRDKFYLIFPAGSVREIEMATAAKYMGLIK